MLGPNKVVLPMPPYSDEISDDLRAKALRARLHAVTLSDHDTAGRLLAYADELEG